MAVCDEDFGHLQDLNSLFAAYRWKVIEKIINRVTCREIINQRVHGYARACEYQRAAEDVVGLLYGWLFSIHSSCLF